MEEMKLITINGMTFDYGRKNRKVFDNFSLTFERGSIYGLLGKNGTGKSTLLYLMCGLLRARTGSITFNGHDVTRRQPSVLSDIFIVPEEFDLPKVTLSSYVKANEVFYPKFSHDVLDTCLKHFDMDININLGELSLGQKKKAFMCFALATNTSLLLMDEPTNGFDIPSKSQMRKVIASGMNDERTIIISTHQVRDVENLLDRVVMIDRGEVLIDKTCMELTEKFCFAEQPLSEPTDDSLYVQQSLNGNSVIMENREGEESNLNLELLFNAMLSNREKMTEIINK